MKRFTICLLVVLCVAVVQSGAAYGATPDPVGRIVDSFCKKNGLTGLSVSVCRNGRTFNYHRGYANLESRDRVTRDSVFRIASVSKLFTTLAVLKLAEQGKLSLDDLLSKYVPAFPHGDTITLKNLLQHTSGIPNFAEFRNLPKTRRKSGGRRSWSTFLRPTSKPVLLISSRGRRPNTATATSCSSGSSSRPPQANRLTNSSHAMLRRRSP